MSRVRRRDGVDGGGDGGGDRPWSGSGAGREPDALVAAVISAFDEEDAVRGVDGVLDRRLLDGYEFGLTVVGDGHRDLVTIHRRPLGDGGLDDGFQSLGRSGYRRQYLTGGGVFGDGREVGGEVAGRGGPGSRQCFGS